MWDSLVVSLPRRVIQTSSLGILKYRLDKALRMEFTSSRMAYTSPSVLSMSHVNQVCEGKVTQRSPSLSAVYHADGLHDNSKHTRIEKQPRVWACLLDPHLCGPVDRTNYQVPTDCTAALSLAHVLEVMIDSMSSILHLAPPKKLVYSPSALIFFTRLHNVLNLIQSLIFLTALPKICALYIFIKSIQVYQCHKNISQIKYPMPTKNMFPWLLLCSPFFLITPEHGYSTYAAQQTTLHFLLCALLHDTGNNLPYLVGNACTLFTDLFKSPFNMLKAMVFFWQKH